MRHRNPEHDAELMALLNALSPERKKGREKSQLPIRGGNVNFSLQATPSSEQAQAALSPVYLTGEDYTRIKVRHWKEQYILPEIDNPVAVGLYALLRAYHAEKGNTPLNIQTRYIYRRQDTGEIISQEERKRLGNVRTDPERAGYRTERIAYGLQELYRRSGGGGADWTGYQLHKALDQLTAEGYLNHDGAGGYTASYKRPERLYNADEFLSFATGAGIAVSIAGDYHVRLDGTNQTAKNSLQHMLDYSRSLGIPDTLRVTLIDRLEGRKVFYDWD